jgi:deoxyhypusine synthase
MRRLLAYVIKNRFVDVLVLSGSLLFHDLHETLGRYHFQAHPSMTDAELESAQISRMWDLLASDEEYREAKEWIGGFTNQLDQTRAYSVREFLHLPRAGGDCFGRWSAHFRVQSASADLLSGDC